MNTKQVTTYRFERNDIIEALSEWMRNRGTPMEKNKNLEMVSVNKNLPKGLGGGPIPAGHRLSRQATKSELSAIRITVTDEYSEKKL